MRARHYVEMFQRLFLRIVHNFDTTASYLNLYCRSGGTVSCALPFTTDVTISTSITQTFLSWVDIFHILQPIACLSHSSYGMPGLAPFMDVLFWERRDFHVSFSSRDMSGDVWNLPWGSSMVDMGILQKHYEVSLFQMLYDILGDHHIYILVTCSNRTLFRSL